MTMEVKLGLLLLAAFTFLAPAESQPIINNVYAEAAFMGATDFLAYVDKAKLTKTLKDPTKNFTVFAPTNVALAKLPQSIKDRLDNDATFLRQVIDFHVVEGEIDHLTTTNTVLQTLAKKPARVDVYTFPNMTTVSGSPVLLSNNIAKNGVVHVLNRVMYPIPNGNALDLVSAESDYSMFYLALTKAGVPQLLSADDVTVFAPTNEAFQRLPAGLFAQLLEDIPLLTKVIQTHLVSTVVYSAYVTESKGPVVLTSQSGQDLNITVTGTDDAIMEVNGVMVTSRDINVDNGVVYVISDVVLPAIFDDEDTLSFRVV